MWLDDSPWLCIADESCLAPQLPWQPGSAAKEKMRQRGGTFKGEIEEKGLDGKDRTREGYRHPIKKRSESSRGKARLQTDIQTTTAYKCSHR